MAFDRSNRSSKKTSEFGTKLLSIKNECDDALWKYWNDGHAVNPRSHPSAANDSTVEFGRLALAHLPNLDDTSKQALLSHISELAFGQRLIPLPKVEESLKLAGEVGQLFGVSAQKIGRLANQHGLKTDQYGELRLDKSKYSDRQCETFFSITVQQLTVSGRFSAKVETQQPGTVYPPRSTKNPAHAGLSCCSHVGDKVTSNSSEGTT
ncbi:hypothetical protein ACFS4T_21180 [Pseudomonas lini]